MKFEIKELAISTGNTVVAVFTEYDANILGIYHGDRVKIDNKIYAIVDVAINGFISKGQIGVFAEAKSLGLVDGTIVDVDVAPKPESISIIKRKLKGEKLTKHEYYHIISDIVSGNLSDIEITYFVSACYMHELDEDEIVNLTNAMIDTGHKLQFKDKIIADKHCIGGVAGNRSTAFVVPIIAAAGVKIPKSSSRSITSPAGTADTMEVLCNVSFSAHEIEDIVNKTNACIVWGGSMDLAPADNKIIKIEHPISLDPIGQMIASILSKKKVVSATHCLIDIPFGKGSKVEDRKRANMLKEKFEKISSRIKLKTRAIITDGSEPIGNGIGPALEARDLIWTLANDPKGSKQLLEKGIMIAGELLELVGKSKKGKGKNLAKTLIDNGKALEKFLEIVEAQGGKRIAAEDIEIGKYSCGIKAGKPGQIKHIDNKTISKIALFAGAPTDKKAGLYLYKHKSDFVNKGEIIFMIYSSSEETLKEAVKLAKVDSGYYLE
jgi:AMP phosphorylase